LPSLKDDVLHDIVNDQSKLSKLKESKEYKDNEESLNSLL
jgi:hypothetical protein